MKESSLGKNSSDSHLNSNCVEVGADEDAINVSMSRGNTLHAS